MPLQNAPDAEDASGSLGRKHVPVIPKFLAVIRIIQFITALAIIGLAAYAVSVYSTSGLGLTLFTAIVSVITTVYALGTERKLTAGYNYYAVLALDLFLSIFWLISFAKTASEANIFRYYNYGSFFYYDGRVRSWRNSLISVAVLGAFQFVLFVFTLLATAWAVSKHRDGGGHSIPHAIHGGHEMAPRPEPMATPAADYNRTPPAPPTNTVAA